MSMEVASREAGERALERLISWNLPDTEQGTTQRLHAAHMSERLPWKGSRQEWKMLEMQLSCATPAGKEDVLEVPSIRHLLTPRQTAACSLPWAVLGVEGQTSGFENRRRLLAHIIMPLSMMPARLSPAARPSPFVPHNYFGGGFVSDDDRVALQSLIFASAKSSGD